MAHLRITFYPFAHHSCHLPSTPGCVPVFGCPIRPFVAEAATPWLWLQGSGADG